MSAGVLTLTTPASSCVRPEPKFEALPPIFSPTIESVFRAPFTAICDNLVDKAQGLPILLEIWRTPWNKGYAQYFDAIWEVHNTFPRVVRAALFVFCLCVVPNVMNKFYKCATHRDALQTQATSVSMRTATMRVGKFDQAHLVIISLIWLVILVIMGASLLICLVANGAISRAAAQLYDFNKVVDDRYRSYRIDVYLTTRCIASAHAQLLLQSLKPVYDGCMPDIRNDKNDAALFTPLDTQVLFDYLHILPTILNASADLHLYMTVHTIQNAYIVNRTKELTSHAAAVERNCDDGGASQPFCLELQTDLSRLNGTDFTITVPDVTQYSKQVLDLQLEGNFQVILKDVHEYQDMMRDPKIYFDRELAATTSALTLESEEEYIARHMRASVLLGDATAFFSWAPNILIRLENILTAVVSYVHLLILVQIIGMTICWILAVLSALIGLLGVTQPSPLDKRSAATLMHLSVFVHEVLTLQIFFVCAAFVFIGVVGERSLCDAFRDLGYQKTREFLTVMEGSTEYSWASQFPDILDRCNRRLPIYEVMLGEEVSTIVDQDADDEVAILLKNMQSVIYPNNSRLFDGLRMGLLGRRHLRLLNATINLPLQELESLSNTSYVDLAQQRAAELRALSTNFSRYARSLPNPTDKKQQEQQENLADLSEKFNRAATLMEEQKNVAIAYNTQAARISSLKAEDARDKAEGQFHLAAAVHNALENATSTFCLRDAGGKVMKNIGQSMHDGVMHKVGKCAYLGFTYNLTLYMICDQLILPVNLYWSGMLIFCIGFMLSMAIGFDLKFLYRRMVG